MWLDFFKAYLANILSLSMQMAVICVVAANQDFLLLNDAKSLYIIRWNTSVWCLPVSISKQRDFRQTPTPMSDPKKYFLSWSIWTTKSEKYTLVISKPKLHAMSATRHYVQTATFRSNSYNMLLSRPTPLHIDIHVFWSVGQDNISFIVLFYFYFETENPERKTK